MENRICGISLNTGKVKIAEHHKYRSFSDFLIFMLVVGLEPVIM